MTVRPARWPQAPRAAAALASLLVTLAAAPVRAQDKVACARAYEHAQELRRDGRLKEARAELMVCANPACPKVAQQPCAIWLPEVEAAIPTVVIAAQDQRGRDLADVKVSVDGKPLVDHLDGRAIDVDPGPHLFRYEIAGAPAIEERVTIRQGEKNRRLVATFPVGGAAPPAAVAPPPEPPGAAAAWPPPARSPAPGEEDRDPVDPSTSPSTGGARPALYVLGGLGLAGLGGFAGLGIAALARENDLRRSCAPRCTDAQVAAVRRFQIGADVSLAVGLVSLGAATYLFFRGGGSAEPGGAQLSFAAGPGLAIGGLVGAF